MRIIKKLYSLIKRKHKNSPQQHGILVFSHTSEVIAAEKVLNAQGFRVEIKGPPPQLQSGCDMVILFDIVLEPSILPILIQNNIQPQSIVALTDTLLEPVSLFQNHDYGDWLMVRAANMKITIEKATGTIVNISGGGCPDVPYLAALLMHQNIHTVEEPRLHGKTLCSYALQKAFEEICRLQPK